MIVVAGFVVAAATGAVVRWRVSETTLVVPHGTATLLVNVSGAFLLGLAQSLDAPALTVIGTAGLGSFTTFSTMMLDTVTADRWRATAYLASTLVLGVAAAWLGYAV